MENLIIIILLTVLLAVQTYRLYKTMNQLEILNTKSIKIRKEFNTIYMEKEQMNNLDKKNLIKLDEGLYLSKRKFVDKIKTIAKTAGMILLLIVSPILPIILIISRLVISIYMYLKEVMNTVKDFYASVFNTIKNYRNDLKDTIIKVKK